MSGNKEQLEQRDPNEAKDANTANGNGNGNENKNEVLTYRGKPLVRKDNVICFGDVNTDKYILTLTVKETKDEKGLEVATKVLILVQTSDGNIVKFGEKDSLYEAFEIGEIWLDSFLKQGKEN